MTAGLSEVRITSSFFFSFQIDTPVGIISRDRPQHVFYSPWRKARAHLSSGKCETRREIANGRGNQRGGASSSAGKVSNSKPIVPKVRMLIGSSVVLIAPRSCGKFSVLGGLPGSTWWLVLPLTNGILYFKFPPTNPLGVKTVSVPEIREH